MLVSKLTGMQTVLRRARQRNRQDSAIAESGLMRAGRFLIRESLKLVPVQFGNLKSTWFVRKSGGGFAAKVRLGYTAGYAIYVHENLDAAHGEAFNRKHAKAIKEGREFRRGVNQQAKFLERPMREKRAEALAMVRDSFRNRQS